MTIKTKRLFKIILFIFIFFVLQYLIGWFLTNDYDRFSRSVIHNMHTKDKIENLFLGTSHLYRGVNPLVIEEKTNQATYILGTPGQELDGAYALLREACIFHPEIKNVYIDIDYLTFQKDNIQERNSLKNYWSISDYLKVPEIKRDFLINSIPHKNYPDILLKIGKEKFSIYYKKNIKQLKFRLNGKYKKHEYDEKSELNYITKGFIPKQYSSNDEEEEKVFFVNNSDTGFDENSICDVYLIYLDKISTYCRENKLNLVFISCPEDITSLLAIGNYEECHNFIKDSIEQHGYSYFDFNYCKKEYLSLKPSDYYNIDHLNEMGSNKLSTIVATVLTSNNPNQYFYKSGIEWKNSLDKTVYGFKKIESEDKLSCAFYPVTNIDNDELITYDYYFFEGKEKTLLSKQTKDYSIIYPKNKKGLIEIECFLNNSFVCKTQQEFDTRWFK